MKKILKYILIFIATVLILFSALVGTSKIPHSAIEENIKESVEFYKRRAGIYRVKNKKLYSYIHYYADTRLLNIIYHIDSEDAVKSTLWANYYETIPMDINNDFIDAVEESKEANTQYLRYWHGSMLILRPLFIVFNIEQIYLINEIALSILALVLLIMLFKKSKKVAIVFLLALILVSSWYVAYCIEYSTTFYVMLIASMIAIKIDSKNKDLADKANSKLFNLFLITGIITCFVDFLTTEMLTLFVPLILVLAIRKEEKREDTLKNTFKFVIKSCILWFVGYAGMWLAKWTLSSLILNINALDYVKDNAMLRINGLQGLSNHKELYGNVIGKNIDTIPLMNIINIKIYMWEVKAMIAIVLIAVLMFIDWKNLKKKKFSLIMIFIGIMPYLRYLILANHSYRHAMFTFRDQIITIMAILLILLDCFNYELLFKKISLHKPKNKEEKT